MIKFFFKKKTMVNDTISDMLTRIRNACMAKKPIVLVPLTRMNQKIAQILEKEGFIQSFQITETSDRNSVSTVLVDKNPSNSEQYINIRLKYRSKKIAQGKIKESCITNLKRLSKPGLRIYANHREIPRILEGSGIVILSTPQGVMTDREARWQGIGGELLCSIW
jgi:small subunit ribosomal protein S8